MVEFRILGPLEVLQDGVPVPVAGARQREMLAVFLLHAGEQVSADRLMDALWGEDQPTSGVAALRVRVSQLRKALRGAGDLIVTRATGYALMVEPERIDLNRFETHLDEAERALAAGDPASAAGHARSALGLWRGPPLADLAYAPFAQGAIVRIEELNATAHELRIEADLALGRHTRLIAELQALVEANPLRERLWGQLMLALYRDGRQADALATYRLARRRLVEEIGIEPGPQLQQLEQRILAQDPSLGETPPGALDPGRASPEEQPDATGVGPAGSRMPRPPTPTIGREADVARLREMLVEHRLVTVIGPGGVGKTRVAIEAAHTFAGAEFVSLAALADAADVAGAIVRQLGLTLLPGESTEAALLRHVDRRTQLLVLDNFEHVQDAGALVARLLEVGPGLTLLVTSREPLRLRSEHLLSLPPLSPDAALAQFAGLVAARDRSLAGTETAAAQEICDRLDGLPLAIELAAGRVGVLSVAALAERLRSSLAALGTGPQDAPSRQRTLEATLEWSLGLASREERRGLSALAAFAGGGSLEAAEAVSGAPLDVLDALVSKNLAVAGADRLWLLETVRRHMLDRHPPEDDVRRRHGEYFVALAERSRPMLEQTGSSALLAELDAELDNFRVGMRWALDRGEPVLALRLASSLDHYWAARSMGIEAARWLQAGLDGLPASASPQVRAQALATLAVQLVHLGVAHHRRRAESAARESLELRRQIGDHAGCAQSLCALATLRIHEHRVAEAYELALDAERIAVEHGATTVQVDAMHLRALSAPSLKEALEIGERVLAHFREARNDRRYALLSASLAYTALSHDDSETASRLSEQALQAGPRDDPLVRALAHGNAGLAALLRGDAERARTAFAAELQVGSEHRHPGLIHESLHGLAAVAAAEGRDERAGELSGAADRCDSPGTDPAIAQRIEARFFVPARARLGRAKWAAARQRLDDRQAIEAALAHARSTPSASAGAA